jgi:SOS response regulatory protein OraA/RecX
LNPPSDPYALCLTWLALRELTELQLRRRLRARHVTDETIEEVVGRLKRNGALDDRRAAAAIARTAVVVKRHGRQRVTRQLETLGIDRGLARRVVQEVFAEVDEGELMQRALARRLGRSASVVKSPADYRRLYGYLVRQGFEPSAVTALLRARSRPAARPED